MAFAGTAGAAASLIDAVACIPSPGANFSSYDGDDLSYRGFNAELVKEADTTLAISISGGALSAYADNSIDGSAADTGILTAGVPGAGEHGLPVNFGPGRGNWGPTDLHRITISDLESQIAAPIAGGGVQIIDLTVAGNNLKLVFKNLGLNAIATFTVKLRYDHSMTF